MLYPIHNPHASSHWSSTRSLFVIVFFVSLALFYTTQTTLAQTGTVDSRSDGSDGALNLTTPGTVIFDPQALGLDPDGDHIFHFTTINVAAGVTVTLKFPYLSGPVYWLAMGDVHIDGTLDLRGEDKKDIPPNGIPLRAEPGAGGFPGGMIGVNDHLGYGPGTLGNAYLAPLVGGSGGNASGIGLPSASNGPAGGGAIMIASSQAIAIDGSILVKLGSGGHGGSGAIHLIAPIIRGNGTLDASIYGSSNGRGRIRFETFQYEFSGTFSGSGFFSSVSTPFIVRLPENPPATVRVVDVASAAIPERPTGSFVTPDATINSTDPIIVTIEARYVPLGSVVKLHIYSEGGSRQALDSTPLAGTFAQSTATVTATVPTGYSRMFAHVDWTP